MDNFYGTYSAKYSRRAIMMCHCIGMPSSEAPRRSLAVIFLSASLTSKLPLGWLCPTIILAAWSKIASRNTSRGCTKLVVNVPIEMTRQAIMRLVASSVMHTKCSRISFLINASCLAAFSGVSISRRSIPLSMAGHY